MKLNDLMDYLNQIFPFAASEEWDNSGKQVSDDGKEIKRIIVGIDLTDQLLDEAIDVKADLIITHHPFVFTPLKCIDMTTYKGEMIKRMIVNDIVCISLHTNYDASVKGMGYAIGCKLELVNRDVLSRRESALETGFGTVGDLVESIDLDSFIRDFKRKFQLDYVTVYNKNETKKIKKIAFCGGAGADFLSDAIKSGADLYITGDITHHDAQAAYEGDMMLMDPTHYGLERVFIDHIIDLISNKFMGVQLIPYHVNAFKGEIR
ncbi:MAG TPA: Nif3-like dinuclear metal center hexameric protein [Clostridiales bacterium]|jgi:dinuclear metal center YbgI/SA1388 family protein|nr:Nif3-like dinuclear metal center hexameric protein [Clostridiales bacterium]